MKGGSEVILKVLLVLSREYGNIFHRGYRGVIFPYSPLYNLDIYPILL